MIKIPIEKPFKTFAIVTLLSGTYICPGWHSVPKGTEREDILLVDEEPQTKKKALPKKNVEVSEWKVLSSKGDKTYTVKNNPKWSCTCPAYQWGRGDCKHIKGVKKNEYNR